MQSLDSQLPNQNPTYSTLTNGDRITEKNRLLLCVDAGHTYHENGHVQFSVIDLLYSIVVLSFQTEKMVKCGYLSG